MTKKILDRGEFCDYNYIVRDGESHFDGAQRAARRRYGKTAFLHRNHSNCYSGPWEVVVHIPADGGGREVQYPARRERWRHEEFFQVLTSSSSEVESA
jgi:hypothetical protein